jgi:hypothetical protein
MRQEKVERRSAPVPQRRDDDLAHRPRSDQAGDSLVLEERLAVDIRNEPDE